MAPDRFVDSFQSHSAARVNRRRLLTHPRRSCGVVASFIAATIPVGGRSYRSAVVAGHAGLAPQWSQQAGQEHPTPVPPPPQGPSYPGQPYPSGTGWDIDPEAPYGRDPITGKPLSDKKAATAGVLELFLGMFGAGRFYIGSKTIAGCQLGLTILGIVLAQFTTHSDNASGLVGLLVLGVIIWGVVDGIRMLKRSIPDGQGRKLR
jgi:TM2 domain-containing membrane protein YozV